ncbi:aminomethyltransferase [Histoplasma ohiense]|nr:aminomethyltransferase [Histoplasma ohiense (nom. inval.)]
MKPSTASSIFKWAALPWLRPVYSAPAIRLGNGCRPLSSRVLCQLTIQTEASSRSRVPLHSSANCFLHHTFLCRNLASSSTAVSTLKKTQLHDLHIAHKARMSPFAGFSMPLVYSDLSQTESHNWTRNKASLFDVSHMVQHHISGPGALDLLLKVTPSSLNLLQINRSTLSCFLDEETGGIIDDTVITRLGPESFYFVTNAGRRKEDLDFLHKEIENFRWRHGSSAHKSIISWSILDNHALVALQGPLSSSILQSLITTDEAGTNSDLSTLHFCQCRFLHLNFPDGTHTPSHLLISRTGYTGEDGFEISIPTDIDPQLPIKVSQLLLSNPNVRLAGLAARDSLRLEAGMCLYGHDITVAQTPPTASLSWLIGKDRRDPSSPSSAFNGASVILPQLTSPTKTLTERRIGLVIETGPPARKDASIIDMADGSTQIGMVTSGLPSPTLGGVNIAMGYVKQGFHKKGTKVGVLVRKKVHKATVVSTPFVPTKFYKE